MPSRSDLLRTLEAWLENPVVVRLAVALAALVAVFVATRLLARIVGRYLRESTTRYQARKIVTFFGYLAAVLVVALVFSDALGGLTVAFGVAGAGVAFALQEVIASIAGWVAVAFGGFYRVGDRVELGGIRGDVIDIGLLRTTLMQVGEWVNADQYNGRIVRVANSFVFKAPVFNYSGEFPFLWDEILIPIKYGSDHRLARDLITRVATEVVGDYARGAEQAWGPITRRYVIERASVQPMVTMVATTNAIEFTARYVVDYKARRSTRDRLFAGILDAIDAHADRVGIAAATINVEKLAPLDVRVETLDPLDVRVEKRDPPDGRASGVPPGTAGA
ncbi:MAG: mechanosensitive ion channel [Vicinamibacterales bacterium]